MHQYYSFRLPSSPPPPPSPGIGGWGPMPTSPCTVARARARRPHTPPASSVAPSSRCLQRRLRAPKQPSSNSDLCRSAKFLANVSRRHRHNRLGAPFPLLPGTGSRCTGWVRWVDRLRLHLVTLTLTCFEGTYFRSLKGLVVFVLVINILDFEKINQNYCTKCSSMYKLLTPSDKP